MTMSVGCIWQLGAVCLVKTCNLGEASSQMPVRWYSFRGTATRHGVSFGLHRCKGGGLCRLNLPWAIEGALTDRDRRDIGGTTDVYSPDDYHLRKWLPSVGGGGSAPLIANNRTGKVGSPARLDAALSQGARTRIHTIWLTQATAPASETGSEKRKEPGSQGSQY